MARKKFKTTGFARFLIVMLFLAPLAYIGASYANGEDGIENFKNLFKGEISMGKKAQEQSSSEQEATKTIETPAPVQTSGIDQSELDAKDEKIQSLIDRNIKLQEDLEAKTKELEDVKAQLKTIKEAIGGS